MYFFKVELSLFDEDKETIFLIPNADTIAITQGEIPVVCENELTSHPQFLTFVKRTKTSIVDVEYELYEAKDVVIDKVDEGVFKQLLDCNNITILDKKAFCIQTRKIKYKKRKKGKPIFPVIGIGAAVLLLIAAGAYKSINKNNNSKSNSETTSDISDISDEISDSSESPLIDDDPTSDFVSSTSDDGNTANMTESGSTSSQSSAQSTSDSTEILTAESSMGSLNASPATSDITSSISQSRTQSSLNVSANSNTSKMT